MARWILGMGCHKFVEMSPSGLWCSFCKIHDNRYSSLSSDTSEWNETKSKGNDGGLEDLDMSEKAI